MNELNETQQTVLAELLQALDQGADLPACLARYPEHAEALRPYLEFRAGLLATEPPAPAAAAYEAGRQTLLGQLANQGVAAGPSSLVHAAGIRWRQLREQVRGNGGGGLRRFDSPLARAGAAGALIFALMGGALGASAGAGFDPARDVLSALRIVEPNHGEKSVRDEEPKDAESRDGKDGQDEITRPEATPTPKLDLGEPKPEATPTPKPVDAEPTAKKPVDERPVEKKPAPTATPRREERPAPTATPRREPTPTPRREPTKTPLPVEPTKTPEPTPTKRPDAPL